MIDVSVPLFSAVPSDSCSACSERSDPNSLRIRLLCLPSRIDVVASGSPAENQQTEDEASELDLESLPSCASMSEVLQHGKHVSLLANSFRRKAPRVRD